MNEVLTKEKEYNQFEISKLKKVHKILTKLKGNQQSEISKLNRDLLN